MPRLRVSRTARIGENERNKKLKSSEHSVHSVYPVVREKNRFCKNEELQVFDFVEAVLAILMVF